MPKFRDREVSGRHHTPTLRGVDSFRVSFLPFQRAMVISSLYASCLHTGHISDSLALYCHLHKLRQLLRVSLQIYATRLTSLHIFASDHLGFTTS